MCWLHSDVIPTIRFCEDFGRGVGVDIQTTPVSSAKIGVTSLRKWVFHQSLFVVRIIDLSAIIGHDIAAFLVRQPFGLNPCAGERASCRDDNLVPAMKCFIDCRLIGVISF